MCILFQQVKADDEIVRYIHKFFDRKTRPLWNKRMVTSFPQAIADPVTELSTSETGSPRRVSCAKITTLECGWSGMYLERTSSAISHSN